MTIYQTLQKYKKRRPLFENSEEFSFFVKNRELLRHVPRFEFLSNTEDDEFNIIRANIIINSYFNKKTIETEISNQGFFLIVFFFFRNILFLVLRITVR